ncbi:hypothetical protein [Streptomyces sp. NPDC056525]|uniref:hypothetical protein n=1 Tax=unclassified Streptomyces TaxID=2593676 RepID=UPI0036AAD3F7
MRARTMVNVAVTACVALVACACGPEQTKGDAGAKPSQPTAPTSASTSTRTEDPPVTPSASSRTEKPSAASTGEQPSPRTKEGAIRRYEQYLHALGHEDIDTVCEVAGPAAKQAEDQGLGPCTSTYTAVFQMISPAQKKALQTATVDPQRVAVRTPGKIEMPVEAVRSSATFSESDLGDYTLEYLRNDWYITD